MISLNEMSRIGKFLETESKLMVEDIGEKWVMSAKGYRTFFFMVKKMF